MRAFEAFEVIKNEPSTNSKQALLKRYDCPSLRTLLYLTYNPYLTYRVNQLDLPESYNIVQPDITVELEQLLLLLAKHDTTPTRARSMIKTLMGKCTAEGAGWVERIIQRDLKIGISDKTINKVFGNLIPTFGVQLAHPMVEKSKGTDRWGEVRYPVVVEEKFDGMRVIAMCDGETVKYYSREGHELNLRFLDRQILSLRPGTKFVLDGEGIGIKFNPNCAVAAKAEKQGKPWQFAQGLSMIRSQDKYSDAEMAEFVGYKVWDLLEYDFFVNQGGPCDPLSKRKMSLRAMFERPDRVTPNVHLVPNYVAQCRQDILELFKAFRAAGGEGAVVKSLSAPYEFKRSSAVLKLKQFYTADLRVLDCIEGTKGTRNEGMLGTMLVGDGTVTGKVMGGFDDDQRIEFWLRHQRGEMVGNIVEVDYMEITADNSLRHASFLRERPDKPECSWH